VTDSLRGHEGRGTCARRREFCERRTSASATKNLVSYKKGGFSPREGGGGRGKLRPKIYVRAICGAQGHTLDEVLRAIWLSLFSPPSCTSLSWKEFFSARFACARRGRRAVMPMRVAVQDAGAEIRARNGAGNGASCAATIGFTSVQ
jgi:hypothetical protein